MLMNIKKVIPTALIAFITLGTPAYAIAQSPAEIQEQINQHSGQIDALNKEIAEYERQLNATKQQKNTLQNKIAQLDLQRKKITASINVTKNQINSTQLQIQQLSRGIENREVSIDTNKAGLMESLRRLDEVENQPLAITVLNSDNISAAWDDIDLMASMQDAVRADIENLAAEKQSLTDTKTSTEEKRAQLVKQQSTLAAQQGSLDANRRAENELLAETKAQESTYQKILSEKQKAKANFESALNNLQSQLQYQIDPSKVTPPGKGVLRWPVDNARLTQQFGDTAFSRSGAYNGKGHNGIDIAASIGTPLKAALTGTVLATGNTDAVRGCYSFGKWVMIKHNNGLNTMYAHLSQVGVKAGQTVSTGQVIGYAGDTGYATGPHLHFGVYVSADTKIITLGEATKASTACSKATMPIVPVSGYLNPMNYL